MGRVTLGAPSSKTDSSTPEFLSRSGKDIGPVIHVQNLKKIVGKEMEISGVKVGNPKILEKNSPKIGGGGQVPQFRNLSRAFGPLSPHTKIGPQDPLAEEILGFKVWTLVQISQKLGSPPP